MKFARWMATPFGRMLRIAAGIAVVWVGLAVVGGTLGLVLAVIGFAPIFAGISNVCLIAPLLGVPFRASELTGEDKTPPTAKPAGQH